MQQVFPLAVLAMAPLAQARFGRFQARTGECPPCPANCEAVTVTVEKTVPAEPTTVFVTHSAPPVEEQQTATTIIVEPTPAQAEQPGPKTVTVIQSSPQQQEETPQVVTRTIQPSTSAQQEPKTVTVTQSQPSEPVSEAPSVVTVTLQPESTPVQQTETTPQESPSRPNEAPSVVTKTVGQEMKQSRPVQEPQTVLVSAVQPSVKTVTLGNGQGITKTLPGTTITAAPETQTIVQSVDHFSTVTQTVPGGGSDNVEIFIININTGESTCQKKHSGRPCGSQPPVISSPCPPVNITTSIATAYNTILVTVGTGTPSQNATSVMGVAQPSGTGNMMGMGRVPRVPIVRRKW